MTPKTMKSSDKPANRARIERAFCGPEDRFRDFNPLSRECLPATMSGLPWLSLHRAVRPVPATLPAFHGRRVPEKIAYSRIPTTDAIFLTGEGRILLGPAVLESKENGRHRPRRLLQWFFHLEIKRSSQVRHLT